MNLKFEISDLSWVWWWLRQVTGDAAYENYLRSRARRGAGSRFPGSCLVQAGQVGIANGVEETGALSREEFYLDALRRRYSRVSRCC